MTKKTLLITLTTALMVASLQAAQLKAPTAELKQGQFSLSFEYSWSEKDIELEGGSLSDFESESKMARISYGIDDWWELFVQLGVGDAEVDAITGENRFAYGVGTKVTLIKESPNLSWGALVQINKFESEDRITGNVGRRSFSSAQVDIDWHEIYAAVGPTYKTDKWTFYGGPFFFCLDGDLDIGSASYSMDEDEEIFGGYIGTQYNIWKNLYIDAEYQVTGDGQALGVSLTWKF